MKSICSKLALLLVLFSCNDGKEKPMAKEKLLPIIGEKKLIAGTTADTLYHAIADFSFINQFGDTVTQNTTKGKIYIADFFFATCQSICPVMSTQINRVQEAFKNNDSVLILSHTVNPMHDTVEVLREYGNKYGAIKNKWHLLTGDKKKIYALAKDAYLVNALQDDGTEEGFLHSETFLLIDTRARIRGIYDGTDSLQVNKLIADIKILQAEKE